MVRDSHVQGNAAFSAGNFEQAVEAFEAAIALDPKNHILYSNKSAALVSLRRFDDALADADTCINLQPDFVKGYSRKGGALFGLNRFEEAEAAYTKALELDPNNKQAKDGLELAKNHAAGGAGGNKKSLFLDPENLAKLMGDERTRALMSQPDFMSMLKQCEENPQLMQKYMAEDERMQLVLEVIFGLKIHMNPDENQVPAGANASMPENNEVPRETASGATGQATEHKKEEKEEENPEKKRAYEEKEEGNAAYKAKKFDDAIMHYERAIELYNQDISFMTNKAAVKFEMGKYEECIKDCEDAIERGRELRADYKLIARAMTRIANSLVKLGKLEDAIAMYNKSLTEHRSADTLKRLNETEKALKEANEAAYVDMDLCSQEKEKGNAAFKEQKYPEAVKHYTEALKRGPPSVNEEAYKLYSNRAACYTKLGAWNEGLKDADMCIELAPEFPKGYSRKGHLQYFMKEYNKALDTYEKGLTHDPDNSELKEGMKRCIQAINSMNSGEMTDEERKARQERAMADPEIQGILTDPIMTNVLREMQENPAAAQKHLSHPDVAKKLEKLIAAGIVQVR